MRQHVSFLTSGSAQHVREERRNAKLERKQQQLREQQALLEAAAAASPRITAVQRATRSDSPADGKALPLGPLVCPLPPCAFWRNVGRETCVLQWGLEALAIERCRSDALRSSLTLWPPARTMRMQCVLSVGRDTATLPMSLSFANAATSESTRPATTSPPSRPGSGSAGPA